MLIRCAWCKTITGNKPPHGRKHDKEVTDGICTDCEQKYFPTQKTCSDVLAKNNKPVI